MELLSLPVEIQEYILSLLDTASLIQCSSVCVLWKTLAQGCWQYCCLREIPSDIAFEILGTSQPIRKFLGYHRDSNFSWETLFLKWNHYRVISKIPHQSFSLPFRNTTLTNRCVSRLSGDFLILAPTVENVRVFKVHIYENGRCVGIIAKHKKPVQDIALMDVERLGPYRVCSSHKLSEHDVVISLSLDRSLQISEINCHGRNPLKIWETTIPSDCLDACVKVFGNTFVVATQDRNLFIWDVSASVVKNHESIVVSDVKQVPCPIKITHLNIWKDDILCLSWNVSGLHLAKFDMVKHAWSENLFIDDVYGPNILTFRDLIFAIGAQLTILRNGKFFQKYDLWESMGQNKVPVERITTLCLKRNLIVIGTQMGEVYVFVVNDDSHLGNLKSLMPVNMLRIGPGLFPCVQQAIKTIDVSFDGRALHIAAQTTLEVHIVHWFPFEKSYLDVPSVELPVLSRWVNEEDAELSDPNYWFYDSD